MSGLQWDPYVLDEDDAKYEMSWDDDTIEVHHFDTENQHDISEYIKVDDDDDERDVSTLEPPSSTTSEFPLVIELPSLTIPCGIIKPKDTVELQDTTERVSNNLISGDFLRVEGIIEDVKTGKVKLKGYRLRRENTLRPQFEGKLNEVYMLIQAQSDDPRQYMIQGLEEIPPESVICKRDCVITNLAYPALSFRCVKSWVPAGMTKDELRARVFRSGVLVCRKVNIIVFDKNGKSYGGEVVDIKKTQCDPVPESLSPFNSRSSQAKRAEPPQEDEDLEVVNVTKNTFQRSASVEICEPSPVKSRTVPSIAPKCTFGDIFCGAGGATQAAVQAGLQPLYAVDNNETAMKTYAANFPEVLHLLMNAHDFPGYATRSGFKVNVLHFSTPCKFWSTAHTRPGKKDQDNLETIYVPEPAIKVLKPDILTMEQAPGLMINQEHRLYFRGLIGAIVRCGYNVRYKIVDLVEYGVPQRRRRLIIIAAKKGIPMPPFPKPTHGPPCSGLKPFVTVYDALEPLRRRVSWFKDKYHQPESMRTYSRPAVDPKKLLVKCITTDGGDNFHYSGIRKNTVREVGEFQTFPTSFKWQGSRTAAMECAGNAVPPNAMEPLYLNCAATLEGFWCGLIDAEEEIDDLYETFLAQGIAIPGTDSTPISLMDSDSQARVPKDPYLYISRLRPWKGRGKYINHSLWGRKIDLSRRDNERRRVRQGRSNFGLLGGSDREPAPQSRCNLRYREDLTQDETEFIQID